MSEQQKILIIEGKALGGIDPISYHGEKPEPGDINISYQWNGATWHFINETNKKEFVSNPQRWAPALGGQCSFAMSLGKIVPSDPANYTIIDNKVYLASNPIAGLLFRMLARKNAAEENWQKLKEPEFSQSAL